MINNQKMFDWAIQYYEEEELGAIISKGLDVIKGKYILKPTITNIKDSYKYYQTRYYEDCGEELFLEEFGSIDLDFETSCIPDEECYIMWVIEEGH